MVDATDRLEERADYCGPAEALVAVAQLVVSGADFRRLIREATHATARTLNADRCEVLRLAPDGERLLRVASCDEDAAQDERSAVPSGVSSVAGYALLCGAPVVSRNLEDERRFGTVGAPRWGGPVSAVAAPIPGRGEFGALVAYAGRRDAFDERHAVSAARTASLLGGALRRLDEQEELRHRAEEAERRSGRFAEVGETPPDRGDLGLTDRQLEVLWLMFDGRSAKQIASELGLSIHTIHSHQRNLYRALGVGSFASALKRARELGLLESPGASPGNP
jgi:DNA-binding CsgD family transcriptional regulator